MPNKSLTSVADKLAARADRARTACDKAAARARKARHAYDAADYARCVAYVKYAKLADEARAAYAIAAAE